MARLLERHTNRPFTIGALVALAVAVQRFVVTFTKHGLMDYANDC
jgi:hypothetical protein